MAGFPIERLLRTYYLATPVFFLIDLICGANVRAAAFDGHPLMKAVYYGFCLGCFAVIRAKPHLTSIVSVVESSINIVSLVLSMAIPYFALIGGDVQDLATFPITIERSINFLIAGIAASIALSGNPFARQS